MAGNSFAFSDTKINGDIYIYQNDESWHAGLHKWKVSNLDSIKEFKLTIN